jgi:U3 small nucleolar RNA-associated protein 20
LIEPLLQAHDKRAYIRNFTAESFSFLLRKARGNAYQSTVETILGNLHKANNPELTDGVAVMFYECIKVMKSNSHSNNCFVLTY